MGQIQWVIWMLKFAISSLIITTLSNLKNFTKICQRDITTLGQALWARQRKIMKVRFTRGQVFSQSSTKYWGVGVLSQVSLARRGFKCWYLRRAKLRFVILLFDFTWEVVSIGLFWFLFCVFFVQWSVFPLILRVITGISLFKAKHFVLSCALLLVFRGLKALKKQCDSSFTEDK